MREVKWLFNKKHLVESISLAEFYYTFKFLTNACESDFL